MFYLLSLCRSLVRRGTLLPLIVLLFPPGLHATLQGGVALYPIPAEVRSSHFRVAVNGRSTDVLHAATNYYTLNFEMTGPITVSITADDPHFWDAGVEVQPMRLGIRPVRRGATISFRLAHPEKLTIARPGDHFADADMLFLFANPRDQTGITPMTPHVRYYGPGIHRDNIDAASGDTIYLAGGAVVLGSLNIWQVHDVHVLGAGTIIYDGPQNPHADEGWMHKRNWHVIVMDNANNIEIDGITCITRSRSWQIQMRDSHHIGFYNIKVIGGNPNDANQDGMDWLGGGDTTVLNSFFRASDDVFALQGNWDGYDLATLRVPGHDVRNITIEDTTVSTSISNTVRVNWPQKTFNSAHFLMSNVDVIHTGFGGCKVPFAFFELWADPEGKGSHTDYKFHDIRLEDWYSLFQIRQPLPEVRDISFSDMWGMDSPGMIPPTLLGDVSDVTVRNVTLQGYEGAKADVEQQVPSPEILPPALEADFNYSSGLLRSGQLITFTATTPGEEDTNFEWLFGDGSRANGRVVSHTFEDSEGTLLDGSGRFRVLLHVTRPHGLQSWVSQFIVVKRPAILRRKPTNATDLIADDHIIHIPVDGGYTFTLLTSLDAGIAVDDNAFIHTPKGRLQVCGGVGNAVQPVRVSTTLKAGKHLIHVVRSQGVENAEASGGIGRAVLLWEGPGIKRQLVW